MWPVIYRSLRKTWGEKKDQSETHTADSLRGQIWSCRTRRQLFDRQSENPVIKPLKESYFQDWFITYFPISVFYSIIFCYVCNEFVVLLERWSFLYLAIHLGGWSLFRTDDFWKGHDSFLKTYAPPLEVANQGDVKLILNASGST